MDNLRNIIQGTIASKDNIQGNIQETINLTANLNKPKSIGEKDYNNLVNKPSINDVELKGNKSFEDLGYHAMSNHEILELINIAKGV